jgi:hypothetical protein
MCMITALDVIQIEIRMVLATCEVMVYYLNKFFVKIDSAIVSVFAVHRVSVYCAVAYGQHAPVVSWFVTSSVAKKNSPPLVTLAWRFAGCWLH